MESQIGAKPAPGRAQSRKTQSGPKKPNKLIRILTGFLQEQIVKGSAFDHFKYKGGYRMTPSACQVVYENIMDTSIDTSIDFKTLKPLMIKYANKTVKKSGIMYYLFPSKKDIEEQLQLMNQIPEQNNTEIE